MLKVIFGIYHISILVHVFKLIDLEISIVELRVGTLGKSSFCIRHARSKIKKYQGIQYKQVIAYPLNRKNLLGNPLN